MVSFSHIALVCPFHELPDVIPDKAAQRRWGQRRADSLLHHKLLLSLRRRHRGRDNPGIANAARLPPTRRRAEGHGALRCDPAAVAVAVAGLLLFCFLSGVPLIKCPVSKKIAGTNSPRIFRVHPKPEIPECVNFYCLLGTLRQLGTEELYV